MADQRQKEELRRAAEWEMRRILPDGERPAKRQRADAQEEELQEVGRFDYSAVAELGAGKVCGFLVTCNFRNEKTTTKEASQLLSRYLARHLPATITAGVLQEPGAAQPAAAAAEQPQAGPAMKAVVGAAEGLAAQQPSSRPLLSIVKLGCRGAVMLKLSKAAAMAAGGPAKEADLAPGWEPDSEAAPPAAEQGSAAAAAAAADAVGGLAAMQLVQHVARELLADVDAGRVKRPQHCQRIIPVQATCSLNAAGLEQAAARLAGLAAVVAAPGRAGGVPASEGAAAGAAAAAGEAPKAGGAAREPAATASGPNAGAMLLSFGVGYKPRGSGEAPPKAASTARAAQPGETAAQPAASGAEGPPETGLERAAGGGTGAAGPPGEVGRMAVIQAVAGGFERALREQGVQARVDLKAPGWVLLVEVLPVMGASFAALSALPVAMCTLKPKLQMRPVGQGK